MVAPTPLTLPAARTHRRRKIGILDLVTKSPRNSLYGRLMNASLASIMPQVLGVWCEEAGHDVRYVCYTGSENLLDELPADLDVLFIGAFTQAAQLAYALSNLFRGRGAITVLGGPHARCYPEDAQQYFDYVLGFTDKAVVNEVLEECAPHRPVGRAISADKQPLEMPTLQQRWKFVEATLEKAPTIKIVPMIGSLGCPYTCSFCIDSTVDYQPLGFAQLRDDLAFLLTKMKHPIVGWHDPNFGVRFDDYMEAVEAAVPPGRDAAHRREQPVAAGGAAPEAAPAERLPGDPAGDRVVVRPGQQVEDAADRDGQGGAGGGAREHDPALHPLHPDQLRARPRHRRRPRAVRAHQAVPRPRPGRIPRLFAALGVRPGGPAQSRVPACRTGAALPVYLPEQQPRHERPAQELRLACVLRRHRRSHALRLLLASHRSAAACHRGSDSRSG